MNLFDGIQDMMFDVVTEVYGYQASWTPSAGGAAITGPCLLKEPTKDYDMNGVAYTPFHRIMEYRQGYFSGLFEAVRAKSDETVIIKGKSYYVRNVQAAYDGKTYRAEIEATE